MTREEKLELYYKARDAYYGSGEEILSDAEFDALEKELGLENKSDLGKSRTTVYTVKHPCVQGSLSKVQVLEDNGEVDWDAIVAEVKRYTGRASTAKLEATPKLDGVSFEFMVEKRKGRAYDDFVVSTRGNGNYGKDITDWFRPVFETKEWSQFKNFYNDVPDNYYIIIRGEVLVSHGDYNEKFSEFTNPRSFVSGTINSPWAENKANIERREALDFVTYDYRLVPMDPAKKYIELSLIDPNTREIRVENPLTGNTFKKVGKLIPNIALVNPNFSTNTFKKLYDYFDNIRQSGIYALDGFVLKPMAADRAYNERTRPLDCIAVKFLPMKQVTTIRDIVWTAKKTGQYMPVAVCDTIKLDGKSINRASLSNYNTCVNSGLGIGAQITMSLAGDIIPHVYKIIQPVEIPKDFEEQRKILNIPADAILKISPTGTPLLMSSGDRNLMKFVASADVLTAAGVGPAIAKELYAILGGEHDNLCYAMNPDAYKTIRTSRGSGSSTEKVIKALEDKRTSLTLEEIICSMCIPACGKRASKQCAAYIRTGHADFEHIPGKAINWVLNTESPEYLELINLCEMTGVPMTAGAVASTEPEDSGTGDTAEKIPVILTGSPKEFGFATKAEWLAQHPQYVETTSWKDCKLLVTDDLNSTSGKMKKAEKAGIRIATYDINESAKSSENSPLMEKVSKIISDTLKEL